VSTSATTAGAVDTRRCVDLATAMIQCDTRNPPGTESRIIPLLSDVMRGLGATVEIFEPEPGRPSLLARYGACDRSRPVLLVNGHIDVVPVDESEWTVPPFAGVVRGDNLMGRGACDMKGGIAAAIEGLRACLDARVELDTDIAFHLVADEETGGRCGTAALLAADLIAADAAVVPEPSELGVCIAERGVLFARIEVFGRAGHGSDPASARSAVADAALVTQALHLADFGGATHPLLGRPTCNVGTIHGGSAPNIVASSCVLEVDRRVLPGQTSEQAIASLRAVIDEIGGIAYEIGVLGFAEASELPAEDPFVSYMQDVCGGPAGPAPVRGLFLGTDARFLRNQLSIPPVIYGPGSMKVAHAADEFVPIAELTASARSFATLFSTFARFPALASR
jgi:acetylornithine deacetylase/succinyl-diaminopimelate desuccinylase family protein